MKSLARLVVVLALVASGCTAVPAIARIVLAIGTKVAVTQGAEFVQRLIGGGASGDDDASITVNHTDADGAPATAVFEVDEAPTLAVDTGLTGDITLSGNGTGRIVVTVPAGTEAEVAFTAGGPDQVQPEPEPEPEPDLSAAAEFLSGTWEGSYRCGEKRSLELILYTAQAPALEATFTAESAGGANFGISSKFGSFTAGSFVLGQGHWVEQPAGYTLVGLHGTFDSAGDDVLEGVIDGSGTCARFRLEKVSDETGRAPI